jgi:hypothetical protein
MRNGARQRWLVLLTLLTLALSAAAWVREGGRAADAEVPDTTPRQARTAMAAPARMEQSADRVHLDKLRGHASADHAEDAFAPRSWRKPAPKAPAATSAVVVVAPPSAPPLPFTYMGRVLSEEISAVFLIQGERNLIVHEGDVIDATYRVEKLSDAGLTFTHLPTGMKQNLFIGEPQ